MIGVRGISVLAAAAIASSVAACGGGSANALAAGRPGAARDVLAEARPQQVIAVSGERGTSVRLKDRLVVAETGRQAPGGGFGVFAGRRIVALYGHPDAPGLGALGQQGLSASIARARHLAREYKGGVPAFEIIATVAIGSPGPDRDYSAETPARELAPWVRRATASGLYVVLDLQPGRASLLAQAKRYSSLLKQPHVGLGLDPEWKLQPGQRPLQQIGHVDVGEVNAVIRWLAGLTARHHLPRKVLVVHQFRPSMIVGESRLDTREHDIAIVLHMDGQGSPGAKEATWRGVVRGAPRGVSFGWKNFFTKDTPMIGPRATLRHNPPPVMISYQ